MRPSDQALVTRPWLFAACVVVLLKLLLTSHAETVYDGWDAVGYVVSAAKWHWGLEYGQYSHIRVPTFNLYLACVNALGVPLRLANECVLVLASLLVARAVWACGLTRLTAWLAFALLTLHPWTFKLFSALVPDGLYATLLVAFIASLILLTRDLREWQARRDAGDSPRRFRSAARLVRAVAPACLLAALAGTWRQESLVLVVPCAVAWCAAIWHRPAGRLRRQPVFIATLLLLIAPLASIAALNHAYAFINIRTIGLYAPADFLAPGYARLHKALLSIPPTPRDITPKLHAPADVRQRAYEVSPTLALLKPWLEGDALALYAPLVRDVSPHRDEYGAWLVWGLREAAFRYKAWPDAGELDRFFAQAADEIRTAQREGRLERRFAPFSVIAPQWRGFLRELPESASQSWTISTGPSSLFKDHGIVLDPYTRALFDRVTLRRTGLDEPDASEPAQSARRDVLWHNQRTSAKLTSIWSSWNTMHGRVLAWAWWLPLIALAAWTWHAARMRRVSLVAVFLACAVITALARLTLVCLLDASGVWSQHRYLLAFSMLSDLAMLLALATTIREARNWLHR